MITLPSTLAAQRDAADPLVSAFVAANAGAGKTRVLTERVARLLIAGAAPEKILCITYTKAAAAEMADRLFRLLGGWALADDEDLRRAIAALDGAPPQDGFDVGAARRLFARALETPGGLKILTIHAFCENVLKRFPLEAGVAPGFSVLTDDEAKALATEALDTAILSGGASAALSRLASMQGPSALRDLIVSGLLSRRKLDRLPRPDKRRAALATALGIDPWTEEAAAIKEACAVVSMEDMARAQAVLRLGGKQAAGLANGPIEAFFAAADATSRVEALAKLFFKSDGEVREKFADAAITRQDSAIEPFLVERAAAFASAFQHWRAAVALEDSLAYFALIDASLAVYNARKAAAAALDFDDLIARAGRLLSSSENSAWVLYKLDQGVDHILLDEAQDTSPAQWGLLETLLAEMTAGDGARAAGRTFFAVGDQKQSIYAFQGADAALFEQKRVDLGKKIEAVSTFKQPELALSFRSTPPVLQFVDALFAEADARKGLVALDGRVAHGAERQGHAGRVEIWPLEARGAASDLPTWEAPVDSLGADDPVRRLTERIAAEIAEWVSRGERLSSADRLIAPGDVLILVQARSALFHEMIRALSIKGLPVAGADRIKMLEEAAVEDLLAFGRAALVEGDDLSLAETLKGPLFGWSDDALFRLAHDRQGTLASALERDGSAQAIEAHKAIMEARLVGVRDGAFAFFTHVLETGAPSGRKRLYARLGAASRDPIEELLRQTLDYEARRPRSLGGFLAWFAAAAGDVKREMSEAGASVRVMTVHGAKGLEAPIVFLLDAQRTPNPRPSSPLLDLPPNAERAAPPLFAYARSKSEDCDALAAARARWKALEYEEYRRKLYVAATRARDRLYVCGIESGAGDPASKRVDEASWHALSLQAMGRLGSARREPAAGGGERLIIETAQTAPAKSEPAQAQGDAAESPAFLTIPARTETPVQRLRPSRLAAEEADDGPAFSPAARADAFLRGRSIHRLLELLPDIIPERRADAADRMLSRIAPEAAGAARASWRDEALAIMTDSAFAEVFSGRGRAEAPLVGRIRLPGGEALVSGAIDRLAVLETRVLVVDYKTNRPPPLRVEDAPKSYVAQLAAYRSLLQQIYPSREIVCALLWTYAPRLMPVPAAMLDRALVTALG